MNSYEWLVRILDIYKIPASNIICSAKYDNHYISLLKCNYTPEDLESFYSVLRNMSMEDAFGNGIIIWLPNGHISAEMNFDAMCDDSEYVWECILSIEIPEVCR